MVEVDKVKGLAVGGGGVVEGFLFDDRVVLGLADGEVVGDGPIGAKEGDLGL